VGLFISNKAFEVVLSKGPAACGYGATCGPLVPLKWLSGFHKTWNFDLHLIDIRMKLITF